MKILHCADLHIREKDIDEIDCCLSTIIRSAQEERVDLAVIAGDIFDSRDIKLDSRSALMAVGFVSALADICPIAIIKGTESHDGMAPAILRHVKGKFDVVVATHPQQLYLEDGFLYDRPAGGEDFKTPECIVTLIPQFTKQYFQSDGGIAEGDDAIGQAMSGVFMGFGAQAAEYPNVPHVLVGHWQVSGSRMSNGQLATGRDIEVSYDQMMMANPDVICLGHIHLPQQIGERAFYSGSVYATNIGEDHKHSFMIHGIKTGDQTLPFYHNYVDTPCRKSVRFKRDFTDGLPSEPIPLTGVSGAYVRIEMTHWQDAVSGIDTEAIRKDFMEAGALSVDIRIIRIPRETVRAASVLEAETLRDKLSRMAEIKNEQVSESILTKADQLEGMLADELVGRSAA